MTSPSLALPSEPKLKGVGTPHIQLKVDERTIVAMSTLDAQEVLAIPAQRLTVMPNMPAIAMGLLNHRSRVFWVIDLPQLMGLTPLDPRALEYPLAILRVQNLSLGIAIQEVQGVVRLRDEQIQSPIGYVQEAWVPYLRGYIPQASGHLFVLDAEAIAKVSLA